MCFSALFLDLFLPFVYIPVKIFFSSCGIKKSVLLCHVGNEALVALRIQIMKIHFIFKAPFQDLPSTLTTMNIL